MFFGVTGAGPLLRDKYGHSQHGQLYAAAMAWPHYWVVLVGAFCSTLGAALQCLTSKYASPRPHYWVVLVGAFCSTLGAALHCLTSECASTGPDRPMLLPGYSPCHASNLVDFTPVVNRIYLHACDS